jgi:hypothetical protein
VLRGDPDANFHGVPIATAQREHGELSPMEMDAISRQESAAPLEHVHSKREQVKFVNEAMHDKQRPAEDNDHMFPHRRHTKKERDGAKLYK